MAPFFVNCEEYSKLVSEGLDRSLSLWEKALLKIHALVCPPCEQVEDHFETLAEACRFVPEDDSHEQNETAELPKDTCARIKAALVKAHENSSA